ncbi:MAG TPA: EthD domain-containing protein, partial [Novosphingobium sp.]|nr:EthD domain-containing protein [Novosphingobium sp.]
HYIGFIRRRAGMSHADFARYWGTVHRDLVMAFADPGPILGYVQDVGLAAAPAGLANSFDGAPELWIRDAAALAELFAAEGFRHAYDVDSPRFITLPAISFFVADTVIRDGAADGVKLMRLIPADPGRPALQAAWAGAHQPIGMAGAEPCRLVRARILSGEAEGSDAAAWLGIESSWWPDAETAARAWQARDAALTGAERVLLARERVILGPC